jgi:hypothetical protein
VNTGRCHPVGSHAQRGLLEHLELRLARVDAGDAIGAAIERAEDVNIYFPDGLAAWLDEAGGLASELPWLTLAAVADRHWSERAAWWSASVNPTQIARLTLAFICATAPTRVERRISELAREPERWEIAPDELERARLRMRIHRRPVETASGPSIVTRALRESGGRTRALAEFICEALPVLYHHGGRPVRREALCSLPGEIPSFADAESRLRLWNVLALGAWRDGSPHLALACLDQAERARMAIDSCDPVRRHLWVILTSNRARVESECGQASAAWERMRELLELVANRPELAAVRWYHIHRAFGIARRAERLPEIVAWLADRAWDNAGTTGDGLIDGDLFVSRDAMRVLLAVADARFDLGDIDGAIAGYDLGLRALVANGLVLSDVAWSLSTGRLIAEERRHVVYV